MNEIEWVHGVPWTRQAADSARAADALEAVTDVARGLIETAKHDPSSLPGFEDRLAQVTQRGEWIAVVSPDLVVVGHGRSPEGLPVVWDDPDGPGAPTQRGRGPKTYDELISWLEDDGYEVRLTRSGHRAVFGPRGGKMVRLVTMPKTASEYRGLLNDVATCRRELGLDLRRQG